MDMKKNNIATSVEQSKQLLELGIDPNTASMSYDRYEFKGKSGYTLACIPTNGPFSHKDAIPAWTLGDMLKVARDLCEEVDFQLLYDKNFLSLYGGFGKIELFQESNESFIDLLVRGLSTCYRKIYE